MVTDALKVRLVLKRLKFQGDITKSTRVTPDFIRLKGKMTLAHIGTVVSYLEQDQKKLRDVSITGLADAVRWVDRLLGAVTILEPVKPPTNFNRVLRPFPTNTICLKLSELFLKSSDRFQPSAPTVSNQCHPFEIVWSFFY